MSEPSMTESTVTETTMSETELSFGFPLSAIKENK
jgi:hypothetical protein